MPMDSKEVELKGKALTKAATGGDPSSTVLSILEELRRGVQASEDLLRSTKIGVIVNKLKTHKDPAVAKQASEVVAKWRMDVKKAGSSGASTPRPVANGMSSPAPSPVPANKAKPKLLVPPEKRNSREDKVNTALTGNQVRDNCLKLMYDGLAFMSEVLPDDVLRVAREVELAAFNKYQPETSEAYKSKMRSLYQNLKNKANPQLRERVLKGEITAAKLVVMTHDELKSAERKKEDELMMKENMRTAMTAQEEKAISTQLKCFKCGERKVSYTQAQTRSADEPMTTFCECTVCGNKWKFC